ncbi:hypothetical protein C8R45DRAFT_505592 [Mycena sanguinolenta]|nr:hypothetical protein C8R45DRAFT_505592 [Mycena sanguinolenta]
MASKPVLLRRLVQRPPLVSKIEVERKFLPTRALLLALAPRLGHSFASRLAPTITRACPIPVEFIRDVYYDRPDEVLAAAGVWVRRRSVFVDGFSSESEAWEAKVRVGGDFNASQFVEVEGAEAVEREMHRVLGAQGAVSLHTIDEQLAVISDLTTRRLSGRLELAAPAHTDALPDLTVAIDQVVETRGDFSGARAVLSDLSSSRTPTPAQFFHEIGELEVVTEVRTDADATTKPPKPTAKTHQAEAAHVHQTHRAARAATLASQLEAFMAAHPGLFPVPRKAGQLRGKLSAYAAWVAAERGGGGR